MKTKKQLRREAMQLYRLCLDGGALDEGRVRRAVQQIIAGRRRGYFVLLAYFRRLVKLDRDQHTAEVATAVALAEDLRSSLQASLESVYGSRINILFAQRPELIGGMRVKVGSDVYDGSVQAGLAALERRF
jgi:F-type H+-transporting ATPase subunit delta